MKDLDPGWYRWRRLVNLQESCCNDEWCEVTVKFPSISIWPARQRVLEEIFSKGDSMIRQRHESRCSIEWEGGIYIGSEEQTKKSFWNSSKVSARALFDCQMFVSAVGLRVVHLYCAGTVEAVRRRKWEGSKEIDSNLWFLAPSASALPSCPLASPNSWKIVYANYFPFCLFCRKFILVQQIR